MYSTEQGNMSQYLTFMLGEETFAVNIDFTREVLEVPPITKVPRTPDFMPGVINLRGNVVPVVDVRLKFGMPAQKITQDSAIIIMEINFDNEQVTAGALVDKVDEVIELDNKSIETPPKIGMPVSTEVIEGIGKRGDNFIIILNINRLFSPKELELTQNHSEEKKI
ncbi:MAG: chemotaxis protein CheW [Spirochaetes bacterium]|nr:MAG: chemotaxis protein CheW [Spirochaetota bacterium]